MKEELLKEMDKLTGALREPVAQQDAETVNQILQESFDKMTSGGKIVPFRLAVLDRNVFRMGSYPAPPIEKRLNFRNYREVNPVYQAGRKNQLRLFYQGGTFYGLLAPIKEGNTVIGAVSILFFEEELKRKNVSGEEFLRIDFNQ